MSKFKRVLVWLILVLMFAAAGSYLWYSMQPKVEKIEEPDIPEPDIEVPLPDPDEEE